MELLVYGISMMLKDFCYYEWEIILVKIQDFCYYEWEIILVKIQDFCYYEWEIIRVKIQDFCYYEWESYLLKFILGTPLVKSLNLPWDIKLQFHSGDHMLEQQPLVSTILQPTWHKPISYNFCGFYW
jgi:hypothetical protein